MISLLIDVPAPLPARAGLDAVLGLLRDLPGDIAFAAALGAMIAVVVPLGGRPGLALWDRVIPYPGDPGTRARVGADETDRRSIEPPAPIDLPSDGRMTPAAPAFSGARPGPHPGTDQRPEAA
ncbi:MAG: hypothetical protein WKF80_10835 [Thermomicrobiales bacterium]